MLILTDVINRANIIDNGAMLIFLTDAFTLPLLNVLQCLLTYFQIMEMVALTMKMTLTKW